MHLGLALESSSPRLQKLIAKNLDLERFRETMAYLCSQHPHVVLDLNTMHGFPTETEKEALMTLDFIKSMKWIDFPYIHVLKVMPNTDMEKLALENGVPADAINASANLAFHELPETLPFDKSFSLSYQADFFNEYFMSKERLLHVLPYQMKALCEDEIAQKYNSYLPVEITTFDNLLAFLGIKRDELTVARGMDEEAIKAPHLNEQLRKHFPAHTPGPRALKVLLLDLSQHFSRHSISVYNVVEAPLGLMYLMTYLRRQLGDGIRGKVAKAKMDFDTDEDLKKLVKEFQPDVIGVRTLTFFKDQFHKTIALLRHWGSDAVIVAGGP
ncbi:MAG: B12-binding domain-containing radical SAM protein, partial [bacterium]|nr:B12-binding domain-containing radical SAM protein [bacterium]